ncbi:hypothetical protein LJR225_002950 [Phenylobacterium sp. LjRoot225]|uniref:DUF6644 family protein n=1 Tax=Phenylobacterium sp. LjRoot225 TaxID=3342285 RepID=UPI003ECC53FA
MEPEALALRLETSALGVWARGSEFGYPLANLAHLLGLVMLVGSIGLLDLRLLGLFRRSPLSALAPNLIALAAAGLTLQVISGFIMFSADAAPLMRSTVFRWKLAVIAAALVNVVAIHLRWRRGLEAWNERIPAAARVLAAVSLALWLSAAALGRLIAYA